MCLLRTLRVQRPNVFASSPDNTEAQCVYLEPRDYRGPMYLFGALRVQRPNVFASSPESTEAQCVCFEL